MRLIIILSLLICVPVMALAQQKSRKLFPYNYTVDDLPNGLRLVTVPTDYPNLVALYIVVQTGSRNEVEPGKSGFAHFFEHMMFRGSENYTADQREAIFKRAGAETNAYTSDDRTVYHATFSKDDLDEIMKMEADRFIRLKYALPEFQTESLAVKGEYDKNSANPFSKLYEVLRETAFKTHTYSHTTMGYLKDIQDMPNQFEYSQELFVVLARVKDPKDVDYVRDQILATFKRYSTELIPGDKLNATRSRLRYGFAMAMDSSNAIASTLAPFVSLRRTPETIDKLAELMETISPQDVRDIAAKYFRDESRTIVTLAPKAKESAKNEVEEGRK